LPLSRSTHGRAIPLNLFALIALMLLAHITFTGSRVALSLTALNLHASAFTVGLLMSLLAVIPMLFAVLIGRWTDRVGAVRPALISLTLMLGGALLPGLLHAVNSLYVASVLLGSGFTLMHVAINNAVGYASAPEHRKRDFGHLALGFSISSVCGPVIAGFAIDYLGHANTFLVLAAFPLLGAAVLVVVRNTTRPREARVAPPHDARVMDLLRNVPLRAVFIVSGLLSMGWDLFTFMVPLQGARIGLSASTIGIIMGTFGVATFVVRAAMPWLARTFSEWQTLATALGMTAIVYLLFPLFTAVPVLLALAFFLGLGLGACQPMVMSLIHISSPAGRTGEAVGVRTTVMNASHTFLPLTFGALGAAFGGMTPIFWILAVCMGGGSYFAARHIKGAP
jgi:predicted MFS family arabinose efflux permease